MASGSGGGSGSVQSFTIDAAGEEGSGMYQRQVYAVGITTADGIVTFTVPKTGRLVAISGEIRLAGTAGGSAIFEVSLQSTSQFAVNDATNVAAQFGQILETANGTLSQIGIPLPSVPFEAGSKLYIHRQISGTLTSGFLRLNLWFA